MLMSSLATNIAKSIILDLGHEPHKSFIQYSTSLLLIDG